MIGAVSFSCEFNASVVETPFIYQRQRRIGWLDMDRTVVSVPSNAIRVVYYCVQ